MGTNSDDSETRAILETAANKLKGLKRELKALEDSRREPIAIVGMACRFPGGANSPAAYWDLLASSRDPISNTDARWQHLGVAPPLSRVNWAGLIDDVDQFDAEFFNMSPRETSKVDPQQRWILELAWDALEGAGYTAEALLGSRTGVYMGASFHDYEQVLLRAGALADAHAVSGIHNAAAAGRLSYLLGLQGPCIGVDTACSSSLVALHLACQSLRSGESNLALAGAAHTILAPLSTDMMASTSALSPDGRCRSFDARANGYVRSEGAAVVVVKRLSDAQRDGDLILACIRGSAVNQDGASASMTAPNAAAQASLMREALGNAQLTADDIEYVEAHGTGTPVGDPIEMDALREVYGKPRADGVPCVVGTAKSNIGHMEAAAGMGGLLKVVLALQHGAIPANLHFQSLNPLIRLDGTRLTVAGAARAWQRNGTPRRAAISAFGITGTNGHVILEEAPSAPEAPVTQEAPRAHLLPVSARSPAALGELARRYAATLASNHSIADVLYSAGMHRTHHPYRLAVVGEDAATCSAALLAYAEGDSHPNVVPPAAQPSGERRRLVFVFPGQGSQWLGMGRELLQQEPAFRAALEACDRAVRAHVGWSVLSELQADAATSRLQRVDVVQPVIFSMQVALAALWRAWGIQPDAVVGHSMGEAAAAYVAGALSLEDAAQVICVRSKRVWELGSGHGAMLVVDLSPSEAATWLAKYDGRICIASFNGPRALVLSGESAAVQALQGQLAAQNIFCRMVRVDFASHSPQVEPALPQIAVDLAKLQPRRFDVPFYSTVTGTLSEATLDASYWLRNLRQPVLFAQAIDSAASAGCNTFIEISPHPVLPLPTAQEDSDAETSNRLAVCSLRRDKPERATLLTELGALFCGGVTVNFKHQHDGPRRRVALPTYAWQRQRHWVEASSKSARLQRAAGTHALLGASIALAAHPDEHVWEQELSVEALPYMTDHRVGDAVVVPGAAYVEMMLAAGREALGSGPLRLHGVAFREMLVLDSAGKTVQVSLTAGGQVRVCSRLGRGWVLHAEGHVEQAARSAPTAAALPTSATDAVSRAALYARFAASDLHYGATFQGVQEAWLHQQAAWGRLKVLNPNQGHVLHPALLDAALHASALLMSTEAQGSNPWLPVGIAQLVLHGDPAHAAWTRIERAADTTLLVQILDATGLPLVELHGLQLQQLGTAALTQKHRDLFLLHTWEALPSLPTGDAAGTWVVLGGDPAGLGNALQKALVARGGHVEQIALQPEWPARLQALCTSGTPLRGVVHLWSLGTPSLGDSTLDEASLRSAFQRSCDSAVQSVRALMQHAGRDVPRLWLVTEGAQRVDDEPGGVAAAQTALWGVGRTVAYEHPELRCTCVDIRPGDASDLAQQSLVESLASTLCAQEPEAEMALRAAGARYGARLVRRVPALRSAPPAWRADGTYLITGGLGGLGLELAQWMVRHGARHLALVGRNTAMTPAREAALQPMRAAGAQVELLAADVSVRSQVEALLQTMQRTMPPLCGIVHSATVLDDGLLLDQTPERFMRVLGAKAFGAWHFHQLTAKLPLDFFVMYASAASLLGSPGQSNYAAANAFLDGLAAHRRSTGAVGLSINWGAFADTGLAAAQDNRGARLARQGMQSLTPEQGNDIVGELFGTDVAQCGVMHFDPRQYAASYPQRTTSRLFMHLMQDTTRAAAQPPGTFKAELQRAPVEQHARLLENFIRAQVAAVSRLPLAKVGREAPFKTFGVDSLMALELRNRLESALGLKLSPTLLWSQPNVEALSTFLLRELKLGANTPAAPETTPTEKPAADSGTSQDQLIADLEAELQKAESHG